MCIQFNAVRITISIRRPVQRSRCIMSSLWRARAAHPDMGATYRGGRRRQWCNIILGCRPSTDRPSTDFVYRVRSRGDLAFLTFIFRAPSKTTISDVHANHSLPAKCEHPAPYILPQCSRANQIIHLLLKTRA